MSISLIASPQKFTPAYNECKFIVESNNVNLDGFRYIFQVFESGTSNLIGYYKALPTFATGYGEQDLSKLLSNMVSYDFNPLNTTFYHAENSYYNYDVAFGEEYIFTLTYTIPLFDNGGNVGIQATHPFVVGDQINITQADGGVANPSVEGLHTVIAVTGADFTINALWSEVTDATITGDVKYADNRKTIDLGLLFATKRTVFNAAISWIDMPYYDETDYLPDNTNALWLTNQPLRFTCTLGQDLWLNLKHAPIALNERVYFKNDDGDIFYKDISGSELIKGIAAGPNNYGSLTLVSGTFPLVKQDTKWYTVTYHDGVFSIPQSVSYKINIDTRVLISESHILFLDRMGSWSSFAFQLKSYEKGNIKRETYNKDVTGYVPKLGQWKYHTWEQGQINFNTQVTKTYDLNTNWMSESDGVYFQELMTSPQTYIKNVIYRITEDLENLYDESGCIIHIPESTEYISCNVLNNSFEVYRQRNSNLIKQSIQIRLSNNDLING